MGRVLDGCLIGGLNGTEDKPCNKVNDDNCRAYENPEIMWRFGRCPGHTEPVTAKKKKNFVIRGGAKKR